MHTTTRLSLLFLLASNSTALCAQGTPATPAAIPAAAPDPRPCMSDPRLRRFDFWLGEWDVRGASAPAGKPPASSSIQMVVEGCAILENYRNGPYLGTSHTAWDARRGKWVQNYIDSAGLFAELVGDFDAAGSLVLVGDIPASQGQPAATTRLSFTRLGPDQVRQLWEQSTDAGKTWSVIFDGDYRRKNASK